MANIEDSKVRSLISVRLHTDFIRRLDVLADARVRSRSELIDRAVEEYLDRHEGQQPQPRQHPAKKGRGKFSGRGLVSLGQGDSPVL